MVLAIALAPFVIDDLIIKRSVTNEYQDQNFLYYIA